LTARKRRIKTALALVPILGLAIVPTSAGAQGTADKLAAAEDRLAQVEKEAFQATARYEDAHSALEGTRNEIAATQRALDDASKRISGLKEQLNGRARAAYQLGSTSTLDVLLEAQDLSEFSDRLVYLDRIAQDDADLATRVAVISEELRRLETNLARLEDEQKLIFEKAQKEYQVVQDRLAEAQSIRDEYKDQLAAEQRAAQFFAAAGGGVPGSIPTVAGAGLQACPAPGTSFSDTFGAPRSGGRTHAGVDMMGGFGTPIYAALPGTVSHSTSELGGNQAYVNSSGGTYTFYAHMQGYSDASGSVAAGTLIGYIGDTGNATGTPHLHFEYHPNGVLVNPTPYVAAVC
jgi:murein DD-endopeptidase MepM/ murein hydrolase activator NlpD